MDGDEREKKALGSLSNSNGHHPIFLHLLLLRDRVHRCIRRRLRLRFTRSLFLFVLVLVLEAQLGDVPSICLKVFTELERGFKNKKVR